MYMDPILVTIHHKIAHQHLKKDFQHFEIKVIQIK
jgi:hypothetical protein